MHGFNILRYLNTNKVKTSLKAIDFNHIYVKIILNLMLKRNFEHY